MIASIGFFIGFGAFVLGMLVLAVFVVRFARRLK